jgi:hypothetical protein
VEKAKRRGETEVTITIVDLEVHEKAKSLQQFKRCEDDCKYVWSQPNGLGSEDL